MLGTQTMDAGVKAAVAAAGGVRSLARAIKLHHTTILRWNSVPVSYLFQIEELTGVPRERLRPDIFKAPRPRRKEPPS